MYQILKKYNIITNSQKFIIKDGYIRYNVIISNKCTCQCNKYLEKLGNKCVHIVYVLDNVFYISKLVIDNIVYYDDNTITKMLKNDYKFFDYYELFIDKEEKDRECLICLDSMIGYNNLHNKYFLTQCKYCYKIMHKLCFDKWEQKKDNCPHCRVKEEPHS